MPTNFMSCVHFSLGKLRTGRVVSSARMHSLANGIHVLVGLTTKTNHMDTSVSRLIHATSITTEMMLLKQT